MRLRVAERLRSVPILEAVRESCNSRLSTSSKVRSVIAVFLLIAGGCVSSKPPAPALTSTATIKDLMDSIVDPSAEFLFESVAEIADEQGVREKAPQTDEEWKEIRLR